MSAHDRNRDDIDAIRRSLSSPRYVAQRLGLKGRAEGSGFKALCPVHGDRTPSLSLTVGQDGTLRVRCFGCDLAGDIFSLVAGIERLDAQREFPAVLAAAASLAGVTLHERDGSTSSAPAYVPRAPSPPPIPAGPPPLSDERFAEIVAPIMAMGRLDTAEAVRERGSSKVCADVCAYLDDRGLLELAIAEGWGALPPPGDAQISWVAMLIDLFGEEDVARTGLFPIDDDGRIVARGFTQSAARLVIPWRREDGVITTLQRRRLDDQKPKYVSPAGRAPRLPYGIDKLGAWDPAVPVAIVEGAIDAEALRALKARAGEPVVVLGAQGTQGWKKTWADLFKGRVAAVATDPDKAGDLVVDEIRKDILGGGATSVERWKPGDGASDWGALWKQTMKGAA